MAAVYLHNAVHSGDISDPTEIVHHSRSLSISSAPLLTSSTLNSQSKDPLLHSLPPGAAAASYFNQFSRHPGRNDIASNRLRWDDQATLNTESKDCGAKGQWQPEGRNPKSFSRGWQRTKSVLETFIAAWAIFNAIRYFMAFSTFGKESPSGKILSLLLGTCTVAAALIYVCSQAIEYLKRKTRVKAQTFVYMTYIRHSLHFISSACVLCPAIVNLVLTIIWRNSLESQYSIRSRCHIDIDIMWSVGHSLCSNKSPSWSTWISIAGARLGVTLILLIAYHVISSIYPEIPRRPVHQRLRSDSYVSNMSSPTSPRGGYPSSTSLRDTSADLHKQHQGSESTLTETCRPLSRLGHAQSHSSGISSESDPVEPGVSEGLAFSASEREREEHHQHLLAQISQETDQALQLAFGTGYSNNSFAQYEQPVLTYPGHSVNDDNDDDDDDDNDTHDNSHILRPIPPTLGYNEFGLPYPPDQPVRILNGYVRRMPTIESMGSGEVGSSIGRANGSLYTSSRPPTRNTLLSFVSTEYEFTHSRPPSRPNSLSARAELLAVGISPPSPKLSGTSEHGELLGLSATRVASPTNYLDSLNPHSRPVLGETISTTGSAASYHTANSGYLDDTHPPLSPISTTSRSSAASIA